MVNNQIRTMGVTDEPLLRRYRDVPRAAFVPECQKPCAWIDESVPLSGFFASCDSRSPETQKERGERFLMPPATHARLLQAASVLPSDTVLDIGGGTGYSAAILSGLASKVVAVESDETLLTLAEQNWAACDCRNIIGYRGAMLDGWPAHAPYNVVVFNGAVSAIPAGIVEQMAAHGRLVCVLRSAGERIGKAVLLIKSADRTSVSHRVLFEESLAYLSGFEPQKSFVF